MDCPICVQPYTKKLRRILQCMYCKETCCLQCVRNFCNHSNSKEYPICMFCKHMWHEEFIQTCTDSAFQKEWIEKRKQSLYNYEMSKMPNTLNDLKYDREIENDKIYLLTLIKQSCTIESIELNREIYELKQKINAWNNGFHRYHRNDQENIHKHMSIIKCPLDTCRGYIQNECISNEYQCNSCHTIVCKICLQIHSSSTPCDDNTVKNIKCIMNMAKACPSCGIFIHKEVGCDQMWCVHCNTGFSWETSRIYSETEHIHNPHYFEWLTSHENVETNRTPNRNTFIRFISSKLNKNKSLMQWFLFFYRLHGHLQYIVTNTYPLIERNDTTNLDLRLSWLKGSLSLTSFKNLLHRRFKKNQSQTYIHNIINSFLSSSTSLLHDSFHRDIDTIQSKYFELIEETNKQFVHLTQIFKMHMPYIEICMNYRNEPSFVTTHALLSRVYYIKAP